jgi:hypothetical protein
MHKDLAGEDFRIRVITRTTIHRAFVQVSLYGLLLSQAASGSGDSPFRARGFALFLWRIPQLVPTDPASRASFYFAHQLGTCLLAVLVAGHAAASLFHHFILGDDALQGPAPVTTRRQHEQEFLSAGIPRRSMHKTMIVVAASLALGTATIATATIAFARAAVA